MGVEWFIAFSFYLPDGAMQHMTAGRFPTQTACIEVLTETMKAKGHLVPALKGECLSGPARPSDLPSPVSRRKEV